MMATIPQTNHKPNNNKNHHNHCNGIHIICVDFNRNEWPAGNCSFADCPFVLPIVSIRVLVIQFQQQKIGHLCQQPNERVSDFEKCQVNRMCQTVSRKSFWDTMLFIPNINCLKLCVLLSFDMVALFLAITIYIAGRMNE